MLYRFSIVFLIGLCLVACSSGSMQEESVPVIRFKPDEEGVQKVFGTLDLFVSLLETEIKYPILQGGILPFWTPSSAVFISQGIGSCRDRFSAPASGMTFCPWRSCP